MICHKEVKEGMKLRCFIVNKSESKAIFKEKIGDVDLCFCHFCGGIALQKIQETLVRMEEANTMVDKIANIILKEKPLSFLPKCNIDMGEYLEEIFRSGLK